MRSLALAVLVCALLSAAVPSSAVALSFDEVFPDGSPGTPTFDDSFPRAVDAAIQSSERINLLDYAAGDGTTPDGANVNDAIAAAVAAGRPLYAPGGRTFLVDEPIRLPSGLILFSDGAVFKAATALGNKPVMWNADFTNGNREIALIGFEVDANKSARGTPGGIAHAIWMRGSDNAPVKNVVLRDLYVHEAPMLGITLQNVQDALIERVESAHHDRDGLTFYWNSRRVRIIAPHIHDTGDDMIGLNSEDLSSVGHRLSDFHIVSPRLERQHSQGSGIALHGARRVLIEDAEIDKAYAAAVSVGNWNTTPSEDIVVQGLRATNAGFNNSGGAGHGILFQTNAWNRNLGGIAGVNRVKMRDVQVLDARAQGITFYASGFGPIRNVDVQGRINCSSLYAWGHGVHTGTGFIHGLTLDVEVHNAPREGISLASYPEMNSDIKLRPRVYDSGRLNPSPGVRVSGVDGLTVRYGQVTNTGGRRNQTWGFDISNVSGTGAIVANDLRGNALGGLRTSSVGPGIPVGFNLGVPAAPARVPTFAARSWLLYGPSLRGLRKRGLRQRIRCSHACAARSELLISRRDARRIGLPTRRNWAVIGRGSAKTAGAGDATMIVKLTRAARRGLWRARRMRMRLRTSAHDTAGQARVLRSRLRVRR
jgi:Right handed beta helix region